MKGRIPRTINPDANPAARDITAIEADEPDRLHFNSPDGGVGNDHGDPGEAADFDQLVPGADFIEQIGRGEHADPENEEGVQSLVEGGGDDDGLEGGDAEGEALIVNDGHDHRGDDGRARCRR